DLTDAIEILMRRQGLTESEAIEQYRAIQRRKAVAALLRSDPAAEVLVGDGERSHEARGSDPTPSDPETPTLTPDMGVVGNRPSSRIIPDQQITPNVSVTVAVPPDVPIPAAPMIVPAAPGWGAWG